MRQLPLVVLCVFFFGFFFFFLLFFFFFLVFIFFFFLPLFEDDLIISTTPLSSHYLRVPSFFHYPPCQQLARSFPPLATALVSYRLTPSQHSARLFPNSSLANTPVAVTDGNAVFTLPCTPLSISFQRNRRVSFFLRVQFAGVDGLFFAVFVFFSFCVCVITNLSFLFISHPSN